MLALKTIFLFSLPALPLALLGVSFYVYLPKYLSDVYGISLTSLGTIILVSRVWDALLDPMMGHISDRTNSRWGRRKPWIGLSVIPLAVCSFLLYSLPTFLNPTTSVTILTLLFFVFWTMYAVPYEAWGAELSSDYHERTKLLGSRDGMMMIGTFLASVIPVVFQWMNETKITEFSKVDTQSIINLMYGSLLVLCTAICLLGIKERSWEEEKRPFGSVFSNTLSVLKNKPFLVLLIAYTIGAFGATLPATLILFYVESVLQSERGSLFLMIYFLIGLGFLPFWIFLARRWDKKQAWLSAMAVNTISFIGVLFLSAGDELWFGILVACSALGYGGSLAIPSSMQADIIDVDEIEHGVRREGQFIGLWSVSKKLSAALGAGIALPILEISGYQPGASQHATVLIVLAILYAGVPSACNLIAMAVALKYPINKNSFGELRGSGAL